VIRGPPRNRKAFLSACPIVFCAPPIRLQKPIPPCPALTWPAPSRPHFPGGGRPLQPFALIKLIKFRFSRVHSFHAKSRTHWHRRAGPRRLDPALRAIAGGKMLQDGDRPV